MSLYTKYLGFLKNLTPQCKTLRIFQRIELMKIILDEESDNVVKINGPEVNECANDGNDGEITPKSTNENPSCEVEKELRRQGITLNELVSDNPRLSLDWQPFRGVTQCICASPIGSLTRKVSIDLVINFHSES